MPTDQNPATFGDLFDREPWKWGLRGDVQLWRRMRERFAGTPMPGNAGNVDKLIETAYEDLVGQKLDQETTRWDRVFVKKLSIGRGMSDGNVSPGWWRDTGSAIIIDRWQAVTS